MDVDPARFSIRWIGLSEGIRLFVCEEASSFLAGGTEIERIKLFESFNSFKSFESIRDLMNFFNELNYLNKFTVREVSMENSKVKSLVDYKVKAVSGTLQPAVDV